MKEKGRLIIARKMEGAKRGGRAVGSQLGETLGVCVKAPGSPEGPREGCCRWNSVMWGGT